MDRMMRYMRNSMRNSMSGEHFTESEAKYLVADMYHDVDCKSRNKVVSYFKEY